MPQGADFAELEPDLRRVRAPNPSPMTEQGTNTYLLGTGSVAVIDPGPDLPAHLQAILRAVPAGGAITHILVTHSHLDHSSLAARLSHQTGAPVIGFGGPLAGRSDRMQALADIGGGEGVDHAFTPHLCLQDGAAVTGPDWQITAIHTPGHMGNHLCFASKDRIFTGDHVMGWASSQISPPDGDVAAYRAALHKIASRPARILYPGHGAPVTDPQARITHLIQHRANREAKVLQALSARFQTLPEVLERAYSDTPAPLHAAAARNLMAHLIDLVDRNLADCDGPLSLAARFRLQDDAAKSPQSFPHSPLDAL